MTDGNEWYSIERWKKNPQKERDRSNKTHPIKPWSANDHADFTECAKCGNKRTIGHIGKRAYKDNCCPHCYSVYRTELDQAMSLLGKSRVEVTKMLEEEQ